MPALLAQGEPDEGWLMFELLSSTGFGLSLLILAGMVGVPLAIWWDKRKGARR